MTKTISRTCLLAMLSIGVTAYAQTTGQTPTQPPSQAGSQRMEQPRQPGDRTQTDQQMTLVGCVQREAEYRQANEGGRGGAMGTGLGVGNEFVLTNASNAPASGSQTAMSGTTSPTGSTTAGTSGTATTTGTGTTGSATGTTTGTPTTPSHTEHSGMSVSAGGQAYALTGDREKELEQYVGQRVEIVGQVAAGASGAGRSGASASGTGSATGTTSGTTATGTTSGTATTGTTSGTASGTATTGTTSGGTQASASAGQSFGDLKELRIVSFRPVGGSCAAK